MPQRAIIHGRGDYVDHFVQILKFYREQRGNVVNESGSNVPQTTNGDVIQTAAYWDREYKRHFSRRSHKDPVDEQWPKDLAKVRADCRDADPNALYPDNAWFWFTAIKKLALHLNRERNTPTKMELIIESIEEAVDDRVDDVTGVVLGAGNAVGAATSAVGDAIDSVVETGEKVWSGLKIAGFIGLGLLGTAIVVPPIVRAFRD